MEQRSFSKKGWTDAWIVRSLPKDPCRKSDSFCVPITSRSQEPLAHRRTSVPFYGPGEREARRSSAESMSESGHAGSCVARLRQDHRTLWSAGDLTSVVVGDRLPPRESTPRAIQLHPAWRADGDSARVDSRDGDQMLPAPRATLLPPPPGRPPPKLASNACVPARACGRARVCVFVCLCVCACVICVCVWSRRRHLQNGRKLSSESIDTAERVNT